MAPPLPNAGSTDERKPFCFRQEVGDGFIGDSVLGAAYHFPKGGFQALSTKVPRVGAYFAVYTGAYAAIEYAMVSARGKEEPVLNAAVATGGACGIAAVLPWGVRSAAEIALFGAAFSGAFHAGVHKIKEGLHRRKKLSQQQADDPTPAACPTSPVEFPTETPPVVA